jgi:hypothetical protein
MLTHVYVNSTYYKSADYTIQYFLPIVCDICLNVFNLHNAEQRKNLNCIMPIQRGILCVR